MNETEHVMKSEFKATKSKTRTQPYSNTKIKFPRNVKSFREKLWQQTVPLILRKQTDPYEKNRPTFKSKRFSQPLGTCKSRSSSWDSLASLEGDPPPSKSRVIKADDFSPLESIPKLRCWSSLYPFRTRNRELTSAAITGTSHTFFSERERHTQRERENEGFLGLYRAELYMVVNIARYVIFAIKLKYYYYLLIAFDIF